MSPLAVRRYRAERLLARDFAGMRGVVIAAAQSRLRGLEIHMDEADLESCYAQAWHGLFATLLSGEEVEGREGWLITVTVRRAIDEHRHVTSRGTVLVEMLASTVPASMADCDPSDRIDDAARLREVFEALRARLSARECEVASLCYLQGLTRADAAAQMGVSARRMDKLMDGTGPTAPGVAAKVGDLLSVIRAGLWCAEQASLMRALAFGLLDLDGERHRVALVHHRECPACRMYVLSLRGLSAVLPPVALPLRLLGAGASAAAGSGGVAAAGGAGTASGGWLMFGGSVTAKVATTCLIALGIGAGCVAIGHQAPTPTHRVAAVRVHRSVTRRRTRNGAPLVRSSTIDAEVNVVNDLRDRPAGVTTVRRTRPHHVVSTSRRSVLVARREFGVESLTPVRASGVPQASAARASITPATSPHVPASSGSATQAQREFGVQ